MSVGGSPLPNGGKVLGEEHCRQFQQVNRRSLWNQCKDAASFTPEFLTDPLLTTVNWQICINVRNDLRQKWDV